MDRTSAGWLVVAPVGFHASALAVHVPRSRPIRETPIWPVLIAPLRHHVENPVNLEELLAAAAGSRLGVEGLAGLVPDEDVIGREIFEFSRAFRLLMLNVDCTTGSK